MDVCYLKRITGYKPFCNDGNAAEDASLFMEKMVKPLVVYIGVDQVLIRYLQVVKNANSPLDWN